MHALMYTRAHTHTHTRPHARTPARPHTRTHTQTGCTVRRYEQLETFQETIEQELRPAVCERRQTDRFKENYSIDYTVICHHREGPGI